MAETTYDILLSRLAALCSQKEKCGHDAYEYLAKQGLPPDQCNKAVDYLIKNQFINNSRFAEAFARDKARFDKWGKNKIAIALAIKKIDQATIQKALDSIPDDLQKETIASETAKKARQIKDLSTPQAKAKLIRFCATRGYPSSLSLTIINNIINNYKAQNYNT